MPTITGVAERLRQITSRKEQEACFVCDKYKAITHLHHVVPVNEMAAFIIKHDLFDVPVPLPTIWLCPNHHAILHLLTRRITSYEDAAAKRQTDICNSITVEEWKRYEEIQRMLKSGLFTRMYQKKYGDGAFVNTQDIHCLQIFFVNDY